RALDGLAIREVGAGGDGARVDDDDVGGLVERHRAKALRLQGRLHLLTVHLVEATAERGERHRPRHAGTDSRSWPQAAPMSSPLLQRTVVVMPASSSTDWNARMRGSGGRWNVDPSQSLNGIRLTLAFTPRSSLASRRASSTSSLTWSSITYS